MRSAELTKERILEAAMKEFSDFGIAGARVDRIAENAGCNKSLIYNYFESKELLFQYVLKLHLTRVYEEIDFTPEDLPSYVTKVFEFSMGNQDLIRLMVWDSLEMQNNNIDTRIVKREKKVNEIEQAQRDGLIGKTFSPNFLLTLIMTLSTAWTKPNPFGPSLDPDGAGDDSDKIKADLAKLIGIIVKS
ncbi:TetR/AcrR family transcriptional regulator [Paenibacillus glycinis]|uniref:TetR family transcriptional regulator n=1 Tax=Paenibacillus glycinis TaxID=2697035 RepID=A0ABW9XS80_9BACL|nr:TetR family transcriptional regulator [Paenibacillus glycinis]NBD25516.1 TetR family transcriptional regulator [Paenibacillus glycinis]